MFTCSAKTNSLHLLRVPQHATPQWPDIRTASLQASGYGSTRLPASVSDRFWVAGKVSQSPSERWVKQQKPISTQPRTYTSPLCLCFEETMRRECRIGPQAWSAMVRACLAHVQAGVPSASLLFFGVSASLRCLICPPRWLARSSTSSQTGHPCRSLMRCRTQQSAFSSRTFMPVAVARLTHAIFFCDTPFLLRTRHLLASYPRVLSRQTNTVVPRSVQRPRPSRPAQLILLLLRARSLRDRFPLPANVTAFLHAARNLSWLASPSAARCSDTSTTTTTKPLLSLAPTDICSALD